MRRGLLVTIGGWATVGILVALGVGEGASPLSPGSLLLCLLLVLAPTGLALPAARALGTPEWAIETIVAWASLGYLLCYVDPQRLGQIPALVLIAPALVGALASPTLLLAAYRPSTDPRSLHRQGYFAACGLCGLLLLRSLGALNPITVLSLVLLGCITLVLLRVGSSGTATGQVSPSAATTATATAPAPTGPPALAIVRALPGGTLGTSGD